MKTKNNEEEKDVKKLPTMKNMGSDTSPRVRPLQLTSSDVETELNYWSTTVYCYVLGANPPFKVIEGFVKRVKSEEMKLRVLQAGPVFFDNKPVIVKEWTPDIKLVKEAVDMVPIWIIFYGLPLKFWGNALMKIAGLIGKPVRCDSNTHLKTFLGHARVMIEVQIGADLPDVIQFIDELDVPAWVVPPNPVMSDQAIIPAGGTGGIDPSGMITPMPGVVRSFSPARIITKLTRHRGIYFGSERRTFMEVLEHSVHYRRVLEADMEGDSVAIENGVVFLPSGCVWWLFMVYGFNRVVERIPLWQSLESMKHMASGPWVVMGDFNNVLAMNERVGSVVTASEMKGFQDCVDECGIMDLPLEYAFFTWTNKQKPGSMVFSRINIAMANDEWLNVYPDTSTVFHPEGLFNHCPCTITLCPTVERKKGSFKYFNIWSKDPEFMAIVKEALKQLNGSAFANIETSANAAKLYMMNVQKQLHGDPTNIDLQQAEREASISYKELEMARRSFLAQKAKAQWLEDGDDNTKYFHSVLKGRRMGNRVLSIHDMLGNRCVTPQAIEDAFVEYYVHLLGINKRFTNIYYPTVRKGRMVSSEQCQQLVKEFTSDKVKAALFSIPDNNAPGPDGLVQVLPTTISDKQSAFIKGRDIIDNILICHDLEFVKYMLSALGFLIRWLSGSWVLTEVTERMDFNYHPLCRPLKLTHLSFADDLLLFCRGDRRSIIVILRAFATFSSASGLDMNCEKSDIYFNGVPRDVITSILHLSGFKLGMLDRIHISFDNDKYYDL
ncbi:uncharacterized protein LOC141629460 [Silene latifolia]|uniref:uncharacterized protein LOC141629460 n=1 Tax=Silene latifolia TaxID=37657 RepID=UPI003D7863D9